MIFSPWALKKIIDTRCILTSIMRRFRKKPSSSPSPATSRPSTPTPQIDYITKELAKFYPREKDKRALAASSSAIALSIVSASCDPGHFAPHEPGPSKDSCWGTVYGAVRIAVETAKESSEAFPPLKAVLGALSVLIQSCDVSSHKPFHPLTANHTLQQTTANMEQIKDTEERIQSLSEILTSPVDDQDTNEKARRAALRKFVLLLFKLHEQSSEPVGFTQDVGGDCCQARATLRTTCIFKVPEQCRPHQHLEWIYPGPSRRRHRLPGMWCQLRSTGGLMFSIDIHTTKHLREDEGGCRQYE